MTEKASRCDSPSISKKQRRILIVDDSLDNLELNKAILEMDDYVVTTAQSGQEALVKLNEQDKPDLILLDVKMEDMSGPDLLSMLEKQSPEIVKSIPIIFFTAMDRVPESRASGFLRRPIEVGPFLKAIGQFIKMKTDSIVVGY